MHFLYSDAVQLIMVSLWRNLIMDTMTESFCSLKLFHIRKIFVIYELIITNYGNNPDRRYYTATQ